MLMSRVILNEWLSFCSTFFFFFIFTEAVHLQRYLVVTWLVPRQNAAVSAHVLCTSYNHAPAYSVTLFGAIYRVHVCLAVTCHLHFWLNDRDLLRATAVTRGWGVERVPKQESAQKVDPGQENYPAASARTRTRDLSITSPAL